VDPTEEKRRRATAFLRRLGETDLLFTGISGSVSYSAGEDDDIDVFLIAKTHRMWRTLLRALILRRLHGDPDICLSLTMDAHHARRLFGGNGDAVMARDAVHVIPIHGADFYGGLLNESPFVRSFFPERVATPVSSSVPDRATRSSAEVAAFLLLGPYLAITSLLSNWRITRRYGPGRAFTARLSSHYFYLDTEKYHMLRERARGVPAPRREGSS
jgi:hypothetical protein